MKCKHFWNWVAQVILLCTMVGFMIFSELPFAEYPMPYVIMTTMLAICGYGLVEDVKDWLTTTKIEG